MNAQRPESLRFRAIWISDIHLGTRGAQAKLLLDFLRVTESRYLYLVGDIVDNWRLRRSWYWPQAHNDVIQKILRKARKGTRVVYVPGNHDDVFRDFCRHRFGNVAVLREAVHQTVDGRRLTILHGDEFDGIVRWARWLAFLGDRAYAFALGLNKWLNIVRRAFGLPYWSLSATLKHKVKNAVRYICDFERAVVQAARERGADGVVCGHIHTAEMRTIDGILYCNDGDWVESCTALVEYLDGRLEVVRWTEFMGISIAQEQSCALPSFPTPGIPRSTESSAPSTP
jgi:UDP-2,3-diacylglucosamine pyrophosphatase LpxH